MLISFHKRIHNILNIRLKEGDKHQQIGEIYYIIGEIYYIIGTQVGEIYYIIGTTLLQLLLYLYI